MALIRLNNQSLTAVTSAGLPSGTVLQVVSATGNTETDVGVADTWTATDAAITITPSNASSKIYISHVASGLTNAATGNIGIRITRNSTVVQQSDRYGYIQETNWVPIQWPFIITDSPSSTSSLTYVIEIRKAGGGNIRHCQDGNWNMVAMEIAC